MELNRESAEALFHEYTIGQSLRKHGYAVEAAMGWYAREHYKLPPEEIVLWGITGLLHDFDYERFPDPVPPDGHPYRGCRILSELGYPQEMIDAIMGHAEYTGVQRESLLAKSLFACDELSGLVVASALVRPDKSLANLEAKSVLKKMKDKAFARGCNRDDIKLGAEELGLPLEDHVAHVIRALQAESARLEL